MFDICLRIVFGGDNARTMRFAPHLFFSMHEGSFNWLDSAWKQV